MRTSKRLTSTIEIKWIHELRNQPSKAIGQSPFFLIYGAEAILPADVM
jgi:hypothetical protein